VRQAVFEKYFTLQANFYTKEKNHAGKYSVTHYFAIYFIAA
jgi:hypothetical protein